MRKKREFAKFLAVAFAAVFLLSGTFTISPAKVFAATTGVVNVSALNLRSGASTNAPITGVLTLGTSVEIAETNGDWYRVRTSVNGNLQEGYVYARYIEVTQDEQSSASMDTVGSGVVNVSALNVREEASTSSLCLGTIKMGTIVSVLGKSSDGQWYQISVSINGRTVIAYAYAQYITLTGNNSASSGESDENGTVTEQSPNTSSLIGTGVVNVYSLNVRSSASTSTSIVGGLKRDAQVEILSQLDEWYQIRANGVAGYVFAQYVTVTSNMTSQVPPVADNTQETQSSEVFETPDSANNTAAPEVDTTPIIKGRVNVSALNVRSGASTSTSILATINLNTVVTLNGVSGEEWYSITCTYHGKEIIGYVYAMYITQLSHEETTKELENVQVHYTEDDAYLLACIVYCEAGNQSYEGQLAVANVVLNRVKSPLFDNSIREVIFKEGQFEPTATGSLELALSTNVPESCHMAAKEALAGNNNVQGYYFFASNDVVDTSIVAGYLVIGDHTFYYY